MKTRKLLVSSLIMILSCCILFAGTTFAWFSDSVTSGNNVITAGNLDVEMYWAEGTANPDTTSWVDASKGPIFNYNNWEPGYSVARHIKISNEGSLALKYKLTIVADGEVSKLADVIDVYYADPAVQLTGRDKLQSENKLGTLTDVLNNLENTALGTLPAGESDVITLVLKMQETAGNEYQKLSIGSTFSVKLHATQLNSEEDSFGNDYDAEANHPVSTDTWDGTIDTSWYNENETEFTLNTAEAFAGFASLVAEDANNFAGKTVKLESNIDLKYEGERVYPIFMGESFAPIGSTGEKDSRGRLICEPFKGTFDGGNCTISNLYQSGWDFGYEWGQYGSIGLFSTLEGATVKNLVLEGFECAVEGGDISFIAGSATGNCTFENITINSGSIGTYNNGIGGIIGWSGAGEYTFKDITLGEDVVIGGLWGSFDSSVGGIVGQAEPGATYIFENVDVACRLDVYNDCTASYDYYNYRMCGMLIGRLQKTTTIDGVNYPDTSKYNIQCTNVTVTYGEWADYHYCDPTPGLDNARGMRVEPGYAYGGIPADYDHIECVASGQHMNLIAFDQIFGGDQYAVKGLKSYEGVTVIYKNPSKLSSQ